MTKENARRKSARAMLTRSGYKQGGHVKAHSDEAEDKALIKSEMKKAKIKLRDGGYAEGGVPKMRADRLARGGRPKHKGKGHTTVNVVVGGQHPQAVPVPKPVPVPVPVGAGPGAGPVPMGPAANGPAMAGGPPGIPDQGPPPGLKRGGRAPKNTGRDPIEGMPAGQFKKGGRTKAKYPAPMEYGAGGGLGRIAKARLQARK